MKLDKVKKVARTKKNEYYNFLDQVNKKFIDQKKNQLAKEISVTTRNENEFQIREIPEGLNSHCNSQKKLQDIHDTFSQSNKIICFDDLIQLKDDIEQLGSIINGIKDYSNFELDAVTQFETILSGKTQFDPIFKKFEESYDKTMKFTERSPIFIDKDKDKEKEYDYQRMQTDVESLKTEAFKFNSSLNKYKAKEINFKNLKENIDNIEIDLFLDFVLEKYKQKNGKIMTLDEQIQGSMFDSDIKETKNDDNKENNFEFEMDGEDIFGKPSSSENNKASIFATDNDKIVFDDFSASSNKVIIFINYINFKKNEEQSFDFNNFQNSDKNKENPFLKDDQSNPNTNNFKIDDPFSAGEKDNRNIYKLETIIEDPTEAESKKASKISFRNKIDSNSEYNYKSNVQTETDRNVGINDFDSYNETNIGDNSIVESHNNFDPNNFDNNNK